MGDRAIDMNAEILAEVAGLTSVTAVLALGAIARGGPTVRRPPGDHPTGRQRGRPLRRDLVLFALVGAMAFVAIGPVAAVMMVGVGAVLLSRQRRTRDRRRRAVIDETFPDAVELFVLCLHAGRSPGQAVRELAVRAPPAVRPGFEAVVSRLTRGAGLADALDALPATLGPSTREVASSVAAAEREGLALAPVLDRLAHDARATRRRQGEAAARKLPVRLSFPLVACTLPAFVLLALAPALLGALSTLRGSAP